MLLLITNRKIVDRPLEKIIGEALEGGVDAVQLREKDLPFDELLGMARELKKVISKFEALFIINRNFKVMQDVKAHGLHVGMDVDLKSFKERSFILGVSIHSLEEAIRAEECGADYIIAGHIFKTESKKGLEPRGLAFIEKLKQKVNIPIIAVGGIDENNAEEVISAGADGIAVMSAILRARDVKGKVEVLKEKIMKARGENRCQLLMKK